LPKPKMIRAWTAIQIGKLKKKHGDPMTSLEIDRRFALFQTLSTLNRKGSSASALKISEMFLDRLITDQKRNLQNELDFFFDEDGNEQTGDSLYLGLEASRADIIQGLCVYFQSKLFSSRIYNLLLSLGSFSFPRKNGEWLDDLETDSLRKDLLYDYECGSVDNFLRIRDLINLNINGDLIFALIYPMLRADLAEHRKIAGTNSPLRLCPTCDLIFSVTQRKSTSKFCSSGCRSRFKYLESKGLNAKK